ncbi:MAG: hypothetical protein COA79_08485 [Planctomycetota bacterium]|nr:MAG: hypothetical protein COA79_08485 [Planctomycetota bacterium]
MVNKEELIARIKLISRPINYFAGTPKVNLSLPENILLASIDKGRTKSKQKANSHHRFLLLIALEGTGEAIINSERFNLQSNECLIIFPHEAHFFHHFQKNISWLFLSFDLDDSFHLEPLRSKIFPFNEMCLDYLDKLSEKYSVKNLHNVLLSPKRSFLLSLMLDEIIREEKSKRNIKRRKRSTEAIFVDKINRFIVSNLKKSLSIVFIAEKFHYSPSHLRAIYKNAMGVSLGEYIKEMRFHKACNYLLNSSMNITKIAEECGYDSLFSFSHAFKNKENISPQAYRKKFSKDTI